MKKNTLFVGDCDESVMQTARQFDNNAVLIDSNNYNQFLESPTGMTGYTSLADLPKNLTIFCSLLDSADTIRYCPPVMWSDHKICNFEDVTLSIQGTTELYLYAINKLKKNVVGLDLTQFNIDPYLSLNDIRKTKDKQLWIIGCSTTAGVGVTEFERYGYLLSKSLDLPVSFLTQDGASISWGADQILRSDIKSDDIVVWGLTSENRLTLWDELLCRPKHVTANSDNSGLALTSINQFLVHKTNFFVAIQKILEVVNFCNKIQAKLLIINILSKTLLNLHLINIQEFFLYTHPLGQNLDIGSDNLHPGPKQHQAYADFCNIALKKLNYI